MALQEAPKVFVVDDETNIAYSCHILKQSGFAAQPFTNPVDALKVAEADAPDLLISDVMMPEMSGVDLAIQLKAIRPECKVLLFSGQAATADLLEHWAVSPTRLLLSTAITPKRKISI